jgi:tRNA 2-thiouridine synthesizing protein A
MREADVEETDPNETLLDLRGLKCPLPALHTRRALASLPDCGLLRVLATDPMSVIDIPHAVSQAGGRVVSQETINGAHRFLIKQRRDP